MPLGFFPLTGQSDGVTETTASAKMGKTGERPTESFCALTSEGLMGDPRFTFNNKRFKACMENDYLLKILRIPI